MAIYAREFSDRFPGTKIIHELENKGELNELIQEKGTCAIQRITRKEARDEVKRGTIHNTRFWVDGGTVRG